MSDGLLAWVDWRDFWALRIGRGLIEERIVIIRGGVPLIQRKVTLTSKLVCLWNSCPN